MYTDLGKIHARAVVYDNKVEHLWTYAQVASAMMMSIAHGSNDGMHELAGCTDILDWIANI